MGAFSATYGILTVHGQKQAVAGNLHLYTGRHHAEQQDTPTEGSFTLSDGNGNGKFIIFPSWMGCMQTNGGVHMVTGGNGNGKSVIIE